MSLSPFCIFRRGTGPIIAAALHHGHDTRPRVEKRLAIDAQTQLREEDPLTGEWAQVAKIQLVVLRSRFEVDLNRPRHRAVYQSPADAWGLQVWRVPPDQQLIEHSLRDYDRFYTDVEQLLRHLIDQYGRLVIYDLHTYNHRRAGPDRPPADAEQNPDVNVGTGSMDRKFWAPIVDRFLEAVREFDFPGRHLDVRENIRFRGGHFPTWVHTTFPQQICAIAIEFKKFFMDEWQGDFDPKEVESIYNLLESTLPSVQAGLEEL